MTKRRTVGAIAILLIAVFIFSACGGNDNGSDNGEARTSDDVPQDIRQLIANCYTRPTLGEFDGNARFADVSFADVRFELVSLVFRLSGHANFTFRTTMYQHSLHNTFSGLADHPVVEFATELPGMPDNVPFWQIFRYAAHLRYANGQFALVDDLTYLVFDGSMWTHENAAEFVSLLNDFYTAIDFATFFADNADTYMTQSERSLRLAFRPLRFDWFEARGISRNNMRVAIMPSSLSSNFFQAMDGDEHVVYLVFGEFRANEAWASVWPFMLGNLAVPLQMRVADEMLAQNPDFYALASVLALELEWPDIASNLVGVALMTLYRIDTEPDADITSELNSLSNMFLGTIPDSIEDVLRMVIAHECSC